MELAINMGRPAEEMLRSMTEAELHRWARYAASHALPFKRLEIMLAQLASLIARTMGGAKSVTANDFMLKQPEDELPTNVTRIEAARKAFNFRPNKIKAK